MSNVNCTLHAYRGVTGRSTKWVSWKKEISESRTRPPSWQDDAVRGAGAANRMPGIEELARDLRGDEPEPLAGSRDLALLQRAERAPPSSAGRGSSACWDSSISLNLQVDKAVDPSRSRR